MNRPLARLAVLIAAALPALSVHAAGWWVEPVVDPQVTQQETQDSADLIACQSSVPAGSYGETEPNNEPESADQLTSGIAMTGQSSTTSDKDWFYLRTTVANEQVTVNFLVTSLRTTQAASWVVSLEDAGGNVLARNTSIFSSTFCTDQFQQVIAEPGFYFISVVPDATAHEDVQYALTMTQQATAQPIAELPPNAVVFRRTTRRMRLPVVAVEEVDGSVNYYDATLENIPGTTSFELIEAAPVTTE